MAETTIEEVRLNAYLVPIVVMAECAEALSATELNEVIDTFQRAQDVGHFLDPTKWRDRHDDRQAILELLRATRAYRKAAAEFLATRAALVEKRAATGGRG